MKRFNPLPFLIALLIWAGVLRSQLYDAQEQAKRDSATIERLRARNAELVAALKKDRP